MIRKIFASSFAAVLFGLPLMASAFTQDDMDQSRFIASRTAASQVSYDVTKLSCVATASTQSAHVGEKFIVAWGSNGTLDTDAVKNVWPVNGAVVVAAQKPGTYKYEFKFYGAGGTMTSCRANVIVK